MFAIFFFMYLGLEDIKYWYGDQLEPQRNQSEGFWVRQGVSPTLPESDAGTWQRMLQKWEKKGEEELSKMVLRGLAKTTRQGHRSALNWLTKADPPPKGISVANWILRLFEIKGAKWAGTTLAKEMASMQGALANLPVYRKDAAPMLLKVSAEWRMGLKGVYLCQKWSVLSLGTGESFTRRSCRMVIQLNVKRKGIMRALCNMNVITWMAYYIQCA